MRNVHPSWSKEVRIKLRKEMTRAEYIFWYKLKESTYELRQIKRQVGIGRFVVDFLHARTKLIIEIDGETHSTQAEKNYDDQRTKWFHQFG